MIRAVGRALAIFDAFDSEHLSLSLNDIAERIGMPKTTAYRLVATLDRAGFLIRMDNHQYCLSMKVSRLAGLVRGTLTMREIARPVMLQAGEQTQETLTLGTIAGSNLIVLEVVDTPAPLMSVAQVGQQVPLFHGAASRVLLAHMAADELRNVLAVTAAGEVFDRAAFQRELARCRQQGHAVTRVPQVEGLTAIAAPVFDLGGKARHCLELTGPSSRVDPREREFTAAVMAAAQEISNRLGAHPQHAIDLRTVMEHMTPPAKGRAGKARARGVQQQSPA